MTSPVLQGLGADILVVPIALMGRPVMRLSVAINRSADGCEKQNKWHVKRKKAHGAQIDVGKLMVSSQSVVKLFANRSVREVVLCAFFAEDVFG